MSINILIIEDEVDIREGISEYLSEVGYEVKVASDGQEGIDLFRQNKFDLVLLDIMLPKINGLGVLIQIRETSNVPVIMLTAMNDDYSQIMSFNEKADDYITKPANVSVVTLKEDYTVLAIELFEGRNRQIRKMCEQVGLFIMTLRRISVGNVKLGDLRPGKWRYLTKSEVASLKTSEGK